MEPPPPTPIIGKTASREHQRGEQPYATRELPGIGGILKSCSRDFIVEEIPAYLPNGQGEHLFLWIEKENVSAEQLTRHIARVLNIRSGDIGMAGMKDRKGITRQYVSVPARCEEEIDRVNTEEIRLLDRCRHSNKLRTGHLKGNRFSILIRDVVADALARALAIHRRLERLGAPNYYGQQRYGHGGETLVLGWDLLKGRKDPRDIPASRRKFLLRLALSAVQSSLFDEYLAARLRDELVNCVLSGDVMQVAASGGVFVAVDRDREQERLDRRETTITGPMFGPKMICPSDDAAIRETKLLGSFGVSGTDFERYSKLTSGTRRPLVIHPRELRIAEEPEGLRFDFELASGVYATTLMREFMKQESAESSPFH